MQSIHTQKAPDAIGVYSQAVRCGSWVFLSGQIPLLPETMQLVSSDITLQIKQTLENLSQVCIAAEGNLSHIVKMTVYLTDLGHFPIVNEIMEQYFTQPYPARAAIEVSALPRQALVEMDAIMMLP